MRRTALLLLGLLAAGQEPIRVTTRMVQVSVIVEDKQGRPVPDLTREDFALTDGKQVEQIRVLTQYTDATAGPAAAPRQTPPAGIFTNRLEAAVDVPVAVTAIVIDQINTAWQKQHYNRDMILQMMRKLDPNHRVGLYVLGTKVRVLHDFTSDTSSLLAAIARMESRLPQPRSQPAPAGAGPAAPPEDPLSGSYQAGAATEIAPNSLIQFERMLAQTEVTNVLMDFERRAELTFGGVEAIALRMAHIPGRKNLIWISSGFPTTFFEQMRADSRQVRRPHLMNGFDRAARALAAADISVYPVHGGDSGGISIDVNQQRPVNGAVIRRSEIDAWNTMLEMADRTGGRSFATIHQFPDALERAVTDARVTYLLGYYPSHGQWDGRYREIKIKVNRPGVRVRHRPGYVAMEVRPKTQEERHATLDDAIWNPLDARGIPIEVRLQPSQKSGAVLLTVMVDPAVITVHHEPNLHRAELDAVYAVKGADGRNLKTTGQTFVLSLPDEKYQQMMRQKVGLKRELELPPGARRVRVVIQDANSEAIGTVTVPLGTTN